MKTYYAKNYSHNIKKNYDVKYIGIFLMEVILFVVNISEESEKKLGE